MDSVLLTALSCLCIVVGIAIYVWLQHDSNKKKNDDDYQNEKASSSSSSSSSSLLRQNKGKYPLILPGCADPGIAYDTKEKEYVVACTDLRAWRSEDLKKWTPVDPFLPAPASGGPYWAPEMFRDLNGEWWLTYTASQRLFIARSKTKKARGPYEHWSGPLLNQWSIDSHLFQHGKNMYIYWNEGTGIKCGKLSDNMKSVVGSPKHCIGQDQPESWIREVVREAPFVMYRPENELFYMLYSGNNTGAHYGLGYATSTHPEGPWKVSKSNPLLQIHGSGHCSFVKVSENDYLLAFHMHDGSGARNTHLGKLVFEKASSIPTIKPL
jgi:beta-xylosidase